jgi:Anti-sigma-K factor rskA
MDTEEHLSKLQSQLDHLSGSLQHWQQSQEHLQPLEHKLAHLLVQGGEILDRLAATDDRHAQAVSDVESRLHEWVDIDNRFRDRAKTFDEICEAATKSVSGIERAESRLAKLEAEMHVRLNQLSTDIRKVFPQLEGGGEHAPAVRTGGAEAWPLEGVMRLHEELRQSEGPPSLPPSRSDSSALLAGRVESLELALTLGKEEIAQTTNLHEQQRRRSSMAFTILGIGVLAAAALAIFLNRRVDSRLNDAAARVVEAQRQAESATQLANQRVASAREDAERRIAEAQQTARRSQIVTDVLSAPDLARFNLAGTGKAPRSNGQVLWSRSRGLVFTASRVPTPPEGTTNQLWLLMTSGQPVNVGTAAPDSKGRVSLVTDDPPRVPRRVIGVAMTAEPAGGQAQRSGSTVLSRAVIATPPPPVEP